MSAKTTIFLLGGTGYIGGSVLTRFIQHPNASHFDITVLVRSEEKAKKLEPFGVRTVVGSLSDTDKLEELASQSKVVVACANADDLTAARALLSGLKKRHDQTGEIPIFIQTSGTGVLRDNAVGVFPTSTIYYDSDPDQMETLAPTQPHRNVDLAIVDADKQGFVQTYIILPSTIYGIASGPLVDSGIMNPYSMQIPRLITASLDRGQAGMIGEGKNIWPNVHIDEVADLYRTIFDAVINGAQIGHGRDGYYFGENGEHTLVDVSKAIGVALVDAGKAKSAEPTSFTPEELDKYFGGPGSSTGANSRCRAEHSRAIGWNPVKTTEDMLASIKPELHAILQDEKQPKPHGH